MNLTPAVLSTATASCSALREPSRLNAIAFNVNEQILVQGQSDQEAEKTYRQRGAISWPPMASNRPARMAHRLRKLGRPRMHDVGVRRGPAASKK